MRPILPEARIDESLRPKIEDYHRAIIEEVQAALDAHAVVVVGMAQNPFCKKARKALKAAGQPFHDLEYGSYLGEWKPRLALKMWSGWPTFPMVFVRGALIGGAQELEAWIADGRLKRALQDGSSQTAS